MLCNEESMENSHTAITEVEYQGLDLLFVANELYARADNAQPRRNIRNDILTMITILLTLGKNVTKMVKRKNEAGRKKIEALDKTNGV